MRFLLAVAVSSAAVLAACSGRDKAPSPTEVVRSWSAALNVGDNEGAAALFAHRATVVQGNTVVRIRSRTDAVLFNESLPCAGRIVALSSDGERVRATFLLRDRQTSRCDGPGTRTTAVFHIRAGKIVLWHQLTGERGPPPIDA